MRPPGITITRYACRELLAQRPGLSHTDLAHGTFVTRRSMNTRPAHNGTALACYQARRPSYGRHPSHRVNRARPPTTEIGKCCRQDGRTAYARQPRCAAAKSTTSSPDQLHRFPQDVVIAVRQPLLRHFLAFYSGTAPVPVTPTPIDPPCVLASTGRRHDFHDRGGRKHLG